MIFEELDEFNKDLKFLKKKYRSLDEDLEIVRKILENLPDERPPFSFRIDNLGIETCVIKVKKIACKALKGKGVNSGLRLVYAYFEELKEIKEENEITQAARAAKIVMIELYHKNNKATEDRDRIKRNFD
ncbi:MAG: hypothetical protein AAF849_17530 [Bacteroidota bacterium]